MKKFFIAIISCLSGILMFAQSDITALEYYIDDDPGVGLGTSVAVTQGQEIDLNFTVPISSMGLSSGVHWMIVRTRNLAGEWSLYERRVFYIQDVTAPPPPTSQDITALEYFTETDPGVGMATAVAITPGQEVDMVDIFNASSLGAGFHTVTVRAKNADERWGFAETRIFYVQGSVSNPPQAPEDITELEYFFDDDPGVGLATSIAVTQGQAIDITEIINSAGLSDGFHSMSMRAKNAVNRWGMAETRIVYVQNINPANPVLAGIVALEYFFDSDPGAGLGTQIPITPTVNSVDIASIMLETGDTLTIGSHTITIRAQNENAEWGHRETVTFNVDGDCPIAGFSVQNACEGEPIQLTDTSSGFIGAVDYRWYADGQLISTFAGGVSHVFETIGTHTFSLAIENGAVCTDSTGVTVEVKAKPFVVFSAESVELGFSTTFLVDEFNVDPTSTWAWDFDSDGMIDDTTPGNVNYTFGSAGTHLTTLDITDGSGCGTTFSRNVIVGEQPVARFEVAAECLGTPWQFSDLSLNIPVGSTYSWDFDGDGLEDDATVGSTQYSYAAANTYTAKLTIETPTSNIYIYSEQVVVLLKPNADFAIGSACVGEAITFTDMSTAEAAATYSWDFDGDGLVDSQVAGDAAFTYSDPGNYVASLLVDHGSGCFDFKVVNIMVEDTPQAGFAFTHSTFGNTASVTFENLSIDGGSFSWDFGDGTTSTEVNPSHDFLDYNSQVFDVCLTTTNGCSQNEYCEQLALTVTGIQDLAGAGIKLYPNPSDRAIHFDFGYESMDDYTIEIFELSGKLIWDKAINGKSQINISQIAAGTYMLHLINQNTKERLAETIVISR
ncbi:MAG: PKD domain-containing protein [Cyclobacteriaceae bacterium]